MKKKIPIVTFIVIILIATTGILLDGDGKPRVGDGKNLSKIVNQEIDHNEAYVLSTSPHGDKKIVVRIMGDMNNELVLLTENGKFAKTIRKSYFPLSEDPYSMYSIPAYTVQWSQNEEYIFISNSIYDIKSEELTNINGSVAFGWVGNRGLYMNEGYYYHMPFNDGYFNYMAISKEINIFENGSIRTLAVAKDNKYFVIDNIHTENMFKVTNDSLTIQTTSLNQKAEQLQNIIDTEYTKMVRTIWEEKGLKLGEFPENLIANGSYYLEKLEDIKVSLDSK